MASMAVGCVMQVCAEESPLADVCSCSRNSVPDHAVTKCLTNGDASDSVNSCMCFASGLLIACTPSRTHNWRLITVPYSSEVVLSILYFGRP